MINCIVLSKEEYDALKEIERLYNDKTYNLIEQRAQEIETFSRARYEETFKKLTETRLQLIEAQDKLRNLEIELIHLKQDQS